MYTRWKLQIWLAAIVVVVAALGGAFLDEPVARAQGGENDYVDVGLALDYPVQTFDTRRRYVNVIVMNHGARTAYDVEVVVDIEYPEDSSYWVAAYDGYASYNDGVEGVPVGSMSLENDGYSFRWTIPALGGLQREEVIVQVSNAVYDQHGALITDKILDNHEFFGEVTTSSFESDLHKGNNTDRIWYEVHNAANRWSRQAKGHYLIANISVDKPNPSQGDIVNFTLRIGDYFGNIDTKVVIELTDGLAFGGTISYVTDPTGRPSPSDSNGVVTIGTRKAGEHIEELTAIVPIRVKSNAVVNEQCLTATITGNPPTGAGPFNDDISNNVAKLCLGAAPAREQVVLSSGTVDLFTWYGCIGQTAAPCNENDSLELVATGDAAPELGTTSQPSQTVVHMPDAASRTEDADGNLVWSTGFEAFGDCTATPPTCLPGGADRSGPLLRFNTTLLDLRTVTTETPPDVDRWGTPDATYPDWERGYFKTEMSGPGKMATWDSTSSGPASEWGSSDAGYEGNPWITSSDKHLGYTDNFYIEFAKLGTYQLTATIRTPYDDDITDSTAGVEYSDKETYTFHVGPIQDVEVRAGDSGSGQTAYTILVGNNGPENTVDATVKIVLPSGALVEDYVASDGTYSNGVWTLPGLKLRDYRRSQGKPEEATLTLILKEGGRVPQDPATATISLTDSSYNVCIGSDRSTLDHETQADCKADAKTTDVWHTAVCVQDSDQTVNTSPTHDTQAECEALTDHTWTANVCATSASKVIANRTEAECDGWHTGTVYEYPNNNNTAKISAVKGTGGAWPDELRFAATPLLTWEAVPHVNDWPVHRYQVQYQNGDNWQDLAEVPGDQTYFADSDARSKPSYRVRALNEAGVPGFWSRAASQVAYRQALPPSPPLNVTAVAGHAGEVLVSWELPVDDGGSPITYYQVQWSRSGTGGWSNACRSDGPSDLSCTQTGIPAGETRYYRVAAYAGGLGDWSDLAVATTIPGVPSAPRSLSASRAPQDLGGETILAIRLTWSAPATDNGSPIYAYAIEYVDYDQSAGRCGTDWQYLGGDPGVHSNDPPTREFIDTGEYSWIGLEPGAHRCYRVSAINSAGEGPFSNVARASAGGEVPPEWVYLDGEADGQDAITLYWGEPHYDGGAPVTGYQLAVL